ncbi:MAG: metallophosphoesterase, partial [Planctomycetota bacterium]|nr:metallophosphoesterase [Planctomycetota bacterium]
MVRLLHCADVHLKAEEREYGLGVLREIVDQARHAEAQFLLICGDLFDGFDDAAALRREVAEIFSAYEGEVIYLPGNHEEIGKRGDLRQFDLGRLTLADELPFAIFKRNVGGERLEVLAIPYQTGSVRWRDWQIPPPANGAIRVAMAHATVPTMVYT